MNFGGGDDRCGLSIRDHSSIMTGTPVSQNYCVGGIFAEPRPQFHSRGLPFRKTSVVVWFLRSQDATITLTLTTNIKLEYQNCSTDHELSDTPASVHWNRVLV